MLLTKRESVCFYLGGIINKYQLYDYSLIMNQFPKWGTILGSPFGVPAYSNYGFKYNPDKVKDYQSYLPKEESNLERDVYLGFR